MRVLLVLHGAFAVACACSDDSSSPGEPSAPPPPPPAAQPAPAPAPAPAPPAAAADWRAPTPSHVIVWQHDLHQDQATYFQIDLESLRVTYTVAAPATRPPDEPVASTEDGATWIIADQRVGAFGLVRIGPQGTGDRVVLPSEPRAVLACGDVALVSTPQALGYVRFSQPDAGLQILVARKLDYYLAPRLLRHGHRAIAIEATDEASGQVSGVHLTDRDPRVTGQWQLPAGFHASAFALSQIDRTTWLYFAATEDHKDAHAQALGRVDLDTGRLPPGDWQDLDRHPTAIVESARGTHAKGRWWWKAERALVGDGLSRWNALAHHRRHETLAIAAGDRGVILVPHDVLASARPVAHIELARRDARDVIVLGDRLLALYAAHNGPIDVVELDRPPGGSWRIARRIALPKQRNRWNDGLAFVR